MQDRPDELGQPDDPERGDRPRSGDERRWDPELGNGKRLSEYELPDEITSAWDDPEVREHPDRPDPEAIHLPEKRRTHILDGDANGNGGGHRHGTGRAGKSEFPQHWDDETVVARVVDVAQRPRWVPEQQPNGRWKVIGVRDDVEVVAIVNPGGEIWTAYPEPGGRGVVENPKPKG